MTDIWQDKTQLGESKMQDNRTAALRAGSWRRDFRRNGSLYLMVLPVVIFYFIFNYLPMYGIMMSFQDFSPRLGISGSDWVGFAQFKRFLTSPDFPRVFGNTVKISFSTLLFGFPAPIIFALLLNEMANGGLKKTVQTLSYLPSPCRPSQKLRDELFLNLRERRPTIAAKNTFPQARRLKFL